MPLTIASLLLSLLVPAGERPELVVRVFPQVQLEGVNGFAEVIMTAEIKGPEDEGWYCPRVTWEFPDGTEAMQESDCAPFEKRYECREPQEGCGVRGFRLDPRTGQYIDIVKECSCTITGYPRIWRMRKGAPAHPRGEAWEVWVRLEKNGKTIARMPVRFFVKGAE